MRISDWSSDGCSSDLLIGCGLGALQQLVGINAVTYYAPSVLKNIGFTDWAAVAANLLISIVGLAMTVVMALVVVDRYGRRRPLMWGALGMAASMRSEEHTSELQSLMRISYAVFCLKKKTKNKQNTSIYTSLKSESINT